MSLSKEELQNLSFRCNEFEIEEASYRLSPQEIARFQKNEILLAKKIADIKLAYEAEHKLSSTKAYEKLEEDCQISVTTIKKAMSTKKRENKASRSTLYKLAVGLKMSLEKANELFALCGGPLTEECLQDRICIRALEENDNIYDFIDEMLVVAGAKIGIRERRS